MDVMSLPPDWRKQLQAVYPKRNGQGWVKAGQQIQKHLQDGESFDDMLIGADNYRKHCAVSGEFVRMAQTFFGPNMWWLEFMEFEDEKNELTLDDKAAEYGLKRQDGEDDNSLNTRLGVAMTREKYK
jgi:hypothetical protein